MSAKTGSAHSRYAGLLPIEPRDDFFRPIGLRPEPIELKLEPINLKLESIDLKPEDVPFPNRRPSAGKRPSAPTRFLIAVCMGVAATALWQWYGDVAREMIANSHPQLGRLAPRSALMAQNPHPSDLMALAAAPSAEQPNAMSFDLDAVGKNVDKTATNIGAVASAQATSIAVESRADGASSQPMARLNLKPTEERPPQTLVEKGKPLASCFASASAVLQDHPGGWPTWTLKAPGHEGTTCWYAAARPKGSDHRRGGTTESGLSQPPAPRPEGWSFGLP